MFECNYKYELEDSLISSKYVYNSQKSKKDKVIAIMLPILLAIMVAMLVADIVNKKSIVWDLILVIALVVLQVMYLFIPIMIKSAQIKAFKKQNLKEMDMLNIVISEKLCTETFIKNNEEVSKNVHALQNLTSYLEDQNRLILVFNQVEFICLRKDCIKGDIEKLKEHLVKAMNKSASKKKK